MEALQSLNELRNACAYRLLRRMLRIGGAESMVFGLWALARGTALPPTNPFGEGLTLIGLFLLLEGIWIFVAPGPTGIILEAATFIVAGLWNLFVSAAGGPEWILALALVQLIWGVQYFKRYPRFSKLQGKRPSKASLDWLDASVKNLAQAKSADSRDVIEFRSPAPWKARLYPNAALFMTERNREVLLLSQDNVRLQQGAYDGRTVKISLQLGTVNINGTITPQSLARLSAWTSTTQSEPEALPLSARAAHAS